MAYGYPALKRTALPAAHQRGQAMVLILLVTVVAVLIGLSLVNTGIIASEKLQLQNAADATAYSISTIEARDLNFTAYTNRAMVANEVAIGQMVGMASWATMVAATPAWLDFYLSPIYAVPVVGQIIMGIIRALRAVTGVIKTGVLAFTKAVSKVIPYVNQAYSTAQRGMHLATLYFGGMSLFEVMNANADNARLSVFGWLALARHINTYFGDLSFKDDSFVTSYRQSKSSNLIPQRGGDPASDAQKEGMQQLAALIHASRDPFSTNRECKNNPIFGGLCKDPGGWAIPMMVPINVKLELKPLGFCVLCLNLQFNVNLSRKGGTDLRAKSQGKDKEDHYIWTAVDTVGMAVYANLSAIVLGLQVVPSFFRDRHLDVPFGIGAAQAAATGDQIRPVPLDKTLWPKDAGGETIKKGYGSSPLIAPVSWLFPSPFPGAGGPSFAAASNNINASYKGLPRYNETKAGPDSIKLDKKFKLGFEAPYLVIGMVKDMDKVKQSPGQGRFALDPHAGDGSLAVIAKSEVFFNRPNDLTWYARGDGKTELANTFNPYWDARLVDTSVLDRTAALAIQQGQPFIPGEFNRALEALEKLLDVLKK